MLTEIKLQLYQPLMQWLTIIFCILDMICKHQSAVQKSITFTGFNVYFMAYKTDKTTFSLVCVCT
jgi:hypothetical protein